MKRSQFAVVSLHFLSEHHERRISVVPKLASHDWLPNSAASAEADSVGVTPMKPPDDLEESNPARGCRKITGGAFSPKPIGAGLVVAK